ncbi:putative transcription factor C2H2 family [Rosa chinensis]|uniref:RING-type E3 ubiquitin transferase n=1 Tax=Rosa chinensis TaxID=74649 RepID=A0A2P6REE4_ROSCH|nr:putative transcription factor C2H2 family [Rosa chinensis]
MPVVEPYTGIHVRHSAAVYAPRPVGREREEEFAISVKFYKPCYIRRSLSDPPHIERSLITHVVVLLPFSMVKQKRHESFYRGMMKQYLSDIGVSETLHTEILDKLFQVIEAAETYEVPILLIIFESTDRRDSDEILSFTPTAESAIEGLEKVRLDAAIIGQSPMCAICWKDFAPEDVGQLMVTRMPCSHCYHGDCIVRWLSVNHLCPMCRYPMPVETQPLLSSNPLSPPPN